MPKNAKPAVCGGGFQGIEITDWKAHPKNTLQGFITISLPCGVVIRNICLHKKNGKLWLSMPARPFATTEGTTGWQPIIEFTDDSARAKFQEEVLTALVDFVAEPHDA